MSLKIVSRKIDERELLREFLAQMPLERLPISHNESKYLCKINYPVQIGVIDCFNLPLTHIQQPHR